MIPGRRDPPVIRALRLAGGLFGAGMVLSGLYLLAIADSLHTRGFGIFSLVFGVTVLVKAVSGNSDTLDLARERHDRRVEWIDRYHRGEWPGMQADNTVKERALREALTRPPDEEG